MVKVGKRKNETTTHEVVSFCTPGRSGGIYTVKTSPLATQDLEMLWALVGTSPKQEVS